ncbi:transposase [Paenibacillus mucilaginosus K02]|uniref:Transposase n=1 Tax=Paenibacillus mucilaginosus K02 TaxID=997761 RepID=I0BTC1_9BACL|nr:transposase [Paenibacillus mucilaginosus K02]
MTTKIHAVVDALGNPLRFVLTGGQCHDSVTGYEMLKQMDLTKKQVLADRAYDTNRILNLLKEQSATSVIPSKKNRRKPRKWDKEIYKERHLIECFFNKVKNNRRLATRYDKLACTFRAFLSLASIMVWLAYQGILDICITSYNKQRNIFNVCCMREHIRVGWSLLY